MKGHINHGKNLATSSWSNIIPGIGESTKDSVHTWSDYRQGGDCGQKFDLTQAALRVARHRNLCNAGKIWAETIYPRIPQGQLISKSLYKYILNLEWTYARIAP